MNSSPSLHRRNFLRTGALATIAGAATSREMRAQDLGDGPIQVGMITHQTIRYGEMAIALASIPGARVCAVTDLSPSVTSYLGRLLAHLENPNISEYSDYREMLDQEPDLDAVIILTPQWLRVRQCVDCMEAGKHVYVLPPLGNDLGDAQVLARHAQDRGRVLQVGYHRRSLPHYRLVKERFIEERGILDPILNANITWRHSSLIDGRLAVPKKTKLHVPLEVLQANGYESMETYSNWRRQRRYSIGPLGGLPAHFIDNILWLFQGNPHTITATGKNLHKRLGDVYTQFHITLEFGQGDSYGVANLQLLDDASVWLPSEVFVGEGMTLLLSDQANQQNFFVEHRFGESNDWRGIAKAEGLEAVTPSNVDLLPQAAAAIYTYTRPTAFYRLPLGEQRRLEQPHLEDFFEAIRRGRAPLCSLAEAYRAEVVLHKILEAVETQAAVKLTADDYILEVL